MKRSTSQVCFTPPQSVIYRTCETRVGGEGAQGGCGKGRGEVGGGAAPGSSPAQLGGLGSGGAAYAPSAGSGTEPTLFCVETPQQYVKKCTKTQ